MGRGARNAIVVGAVVVFAAVGVGAWTLGQRQPPRDADVLVVAHGEEVDIAAHVARGKHTVVDFYAVWCPPCRKLSPALERLAARFPDALAVRKVDIVDWTMPVAKQYGIEELPYLMLFDREGRRVAAGADVFTEIDRLFGEAAREVSEFAGLSARPETVL